MGHVLVVMLIYLVMFVVKFVSLFCCSGRIHMGSISAMCSPGNRCALILRRMKRPCKLFKPMSTGIVLGGGRGAVRGRGASVRASKTRLGRFC